mmetsp:Transcript_9934/g.22695  ORF Transcript_9934/g.22695 Transcript_9934/m.22695 type:complete len:230 (+) Transcript_9934:245-934(+)
MERSREGSLGARPYISRQQDYNYSQILRRHPRPSRRSSQGPCSSGRKALCWTSRRHLHHVPPDHLRWLFLLLREVEASSSCPLLRRLQGPQAARLPAVPRHPGPHEDRRREVLHGGSHRRVRPGSRRAADSHSPLPRLRAPEKPETCAVVPADARDPVCGDCNLRGREELERFLGGRSVRSEHLADYLLLLLLSHLGGSKQTRYYHLLRLRPCQQENGGISLFHCSIHF